MNKNYNIKCDVNQCKYNADGCNCQLEQIKVTCGCGDNCTCCGDFCQKD